MRKHGILLWITAVSAVAAGTAKDSDQLYAAIRSNDLKVLRKLLDHGLNVNAADARGITPLMTAAEIGSAEGMKLLIRRGADVNAQNQFGSTALMWSVTDPQKVKLLLDRGADPNKASKTGRTALLIASFSNPSAEVVRMLIAKGGDPKAVDAVGFTALNAAAIGNDTETIRIFIDAGVDVNAGEKAGAAVIPGATPLMFATANGNLDAVRMLLAHGADPNAVSISDVNRLQKVRNGTIALGSYTALMLAPAYGPPALVKTLLDAGAEVNAQEMRGMTSLMFAAASDRHDPEIVRMLLAHGADPNIKSKAEETAHDWARKTGIAAVSDVLTYGDYQMPVFSKPPSLRTAVTRSVALLEQSSEEFFKKSGCVACHAQASAEFAVSAARAKGIPVNEQLARNRQQQAVALLNGAGPMLMERMDPPGSPDTMVYILEGLARGSMQPSPLTDALVAHLASQQTAEGRWHLGGLTRAPLEDGDFTRTTLAIRALKAYGTPGRAIENAGRIERAKRWLQEADVVTQEDRAMRLAGVASAGANALTLRKLAEPLLARQRQDGGWGQKDELASDAYATGMVLWALAESGVLKPADEAYQRGVLYLLQTQAPDGSWYVASRSPEIQPYFESGFPYGHDQWISQSATAWATNALALALEENPVSQVR